jgi:serine-type D-Ala-D-Ala endopeptidase (penicillin-binding protein 7)
MQAVSEESGLNQLLKIVAKCVGLLCLGIALGSVACTSAEAAQTQRSAKKVVAKKVVAKKVTTKKITAKSSKKQAIAAKTSRTAKVQASATRVSMVKVSTRASARAGKMQRVMVKGKNGRRVFVMRPVARNIVRVIVPARPSFGELAGLHGGHDALDLRSSVALIVDQDTHEVLFSKNGSAVLPIASLTKLMTGVVASEANLDMSEIITISEDDVSTEKRSPSRLRVGNQISRGDLMHIALMSSENRAAHAIGRSHPGGLQKFVQMMNAKAASLGMKDTRYVEPTGLSSSNQSSAQDLAILVGYASNNSQLRELSTSPSQQVAVGERTLNYTNTNRLIRNPDWDIGLQKTGYISEAGQCLVMQARIAGRKLNMVFLDSAGKLSRLGDAERVRRWVEAKHPGGTVSLASKVTHG